MSQRLPGGAPICCKLFVRYSNCYILVVIQGMINKRTVVLSTRVNSSKFSESTNA